MVPEFVKFTTVRGGRAKPYWLAPWGRAIVGVMVPGDEHPHDDVVDKLQRIGIWKWAVCGVALWGIGSLLMLRGSWYSTDTVTENITFVATNTLIGAVLGLLAGWFAVPTPRDPRRLVEVAEPLLGSHRPPAVVPAIKQ